MHKIHLRGRLANFLWKQHILWQGAACRGTTENREEVNYFPFPEKPHQNTLCWVHWHGTRMGRVRGGWGVDGMVSGLNSSDGKLCLRKSKNSLWLFSRAPNQHLVCGAPAPSYSVCLYVHIPVTNIQTYSTYCNSLTLTSPLSLSLFLPFSHSFRNSWRQGAEW